eukprot:s5242_g4.t1
MQASADAIFLAMYTCAAKAGVDIGIDAWPATIRVITVESLHSMRGVSVSLAAWLHSGASASAAEGWQETCLQAFPQSRSELPSLLNCLGLVDEAVEVGVQAGVHAHHFLSNWSGKRQSPNAASAAPDNLFYVDIANVHGNDAKKPCPPSSGRAEILNLDSAYAASQIADGELDFVYLDARHDFAGVVADIHAWWPKVRTGGIFAGHDFVDGEFPEGDFFWLAALQAVLPGVDGSTFIVREVNLNRYPSFFILKSETISGLQPLQVPTESKVLELYANRSKYFKLWMEHKSKSPNSKKFEAACNAACSRDCSERVAQFTPTRTSASTLRPFACGQGRDTCAAEVAVDVTAYKQVCLERCAVTCQQRLELFAAHGDQIQAAASVPGLKAQDAVTAALAGIPHSVVSRDESQRVVEAYVSATWGEEKSLSDEDNVAFDGVMISTSPQHASIQCVGSHETEAEVSFGDTRSEACPGGAGDTEAAAGARFGVSPRTALKAAIGDPNPSPSDSSPPGRSSFLQYASDFFSHSDWAALCQPVSGAVHVIEAELQEAMHAMAILASLESQDFDEDFEVVSGSNEDFENDFRIDAVLLDQAEWKGFQYRAIVYGCLLADAEGILDTHVGPLPRSRRSWVKTLVQTNALSDVRPDQSRRVAAGILAPIQRVAKVLRERVLTTKLREARRSLTELLEASAASAAAASIAAAAADQEPGKEADPELDHS